MNMTVSICVYVLCAALLLWGCRFSGFGKEFHEDYLSLSSTKSLCGISALLIIFHHISQEPAFQDLTGELSFFNDIGYLLVTVFFFSSGYGLMLNAGKDAAYTASFPGKRLPAVLVPFYGNCLVFAVIAAFSGEPLPRILLGITGLVQINPNAWFPIVLVLYYLVFLFACRHMKRKSTRVMVFFLTCLVMISVFCVSGHFAWWAGRRGWWLSSGGFDRAAWWMQEKVFWFNGEWWVNSGIAFTIGAVFAAWKEPVTAWLKKGYWLKLLCSVAVFVFFLVRLNALKAKGGYWTEFGWPSPRIGDKFFCSLVNLPVSAFFTVSVIMLSMKLRTVNPVTRFMGTISYETYLYGPLALWGFEFLINRSARPYAAGNHWNLAVFTLCVAAASIALGWLMNRADRWLVKNLRGKLF